MKLVDELIEQLSGEAPSLTDALLKTKVLLHKIGQKDLSGWVNSELTGYEGDAQLPNYRHLHGHVKGNVTNGYHRYMNHQLPVMQLNADLRERFELIPVPDSISALEELAQGGGDLQRPIPLEANHFFNKALSNGFHVELAWCDIGKGQMLQILTQIRSRLLDFLLELNEQFNEAADDAELREVGQQPETASMFNNAIFGDNVTIMVGDNNRQNVKNKVSRGDFESLAIILRENQVQERQIAELQQAIEADGDIRDQEGKFGPRVRIWLKDMLARAIDTSWQVEVAVASNLLTTALMAYYS